MSKRISLVFIVCVSFAVGALGEEPQYLVRLAPTATMGDPEALATRLARTYGATLEAVNGQIVKVRLSPSRAALLGRDPNVESITTAAAPEKIASNGIDWNTGVTYGYDGSGNVRTIGTDTYSYDVVGRLVEAHVGGVRRQYEYDAFGNRTKCVDASGANCQDTETISAFSNRSSAMTYNAAGDVIAHAGHTYTFDEFHMLTSDTYGNLTREFIYNANDQRIGTLTSAPTGSWWRWTFRDPLTGKVLREFTSQGLDGKSDWKWEKDYIWRDGLLLATIQPKVGGTGTTTYHYHLDHLGTPRRITDDSDVIVGVHDYHAFGPEAGGGTDERSLSLVKYTGHERDLVDGHPDSIDYMMARYYSPTLGRFLSVDPVITVRRNIYQPQRWNRYVYALNNPVLRHDPDGLKDRVIFVSMLDASVTPNIEKALNRAVKGTRFEGNVVVVGPGATPGSVKTWVKHADSKDIVGLLLHSGPNPKSSGGTMMGGGIKPDPTTAFTGKDLAKAASDGSAPILVIAGCASDRCSATVNSATGATTFGTTARTFASEESKGFVEIVETLAHGGTSEDAARAGSEELKRLPPCPSSNPGCNDSRTEPADFQARPPR